MVGFLLAFLVAVDYDLVEQPKPLTAKPTANYSLFDEVKKPEVKKPEVNKNSDKDKNKNKKYPSKSYAYKKPNADWSFPGSTKEELITHLKTHRNHSKEFKDIDLNSLDFQTLKDLHSLDHEHNFKVQSSFSQNCVKSTTKNRRILFFTSDSCPACKSCFAKFAPWLRAAGWTIGPEDHNHIQIVNIDHNRTAAGKYQIGSLPTFIVLENEQVIRRTGYLEKEQVPRLLVN